ncbi:MAG: NAD(P)/FAD-dependent oxidoreductase [Lachnospiraceae bacterium]|nr:NAD(P)/FAD-dependent oxidoreductase [Lachnospiraceae bacterium]
MGRYDIAIIGTGPAGVSAALTAKNRNKTILLIGKKDMSNKVLKSHKILNYPGLPDISGEDMVKAMRAHLDDMGIEITEEQVTNVYAMGDYFALQCAKEMYEAKTVILATGVMPGKLLPGEEKYLGNGVSYCATCDAALYKGKETIVLGYSPKEEEEAAFLAEVASKVYYIPTYQDEVRLSESNIEVIRGIPKEIKREANKTTLVLDGQEITADVIFVLRDAVSPGQLVPGLETDGAHIKTERDMSTSMKGLFAAGDITGTPYQDAKSVGEGNIAAISAVSYLAALKAAENKN